LREKHSLRKAKILLFTERTFWLDSNSESISVMGKADRSGTAQGREVRSGKRWRKGTTSRSNSEVAKSVSIDDGQRRRRPKEAKRKIRMGLMYRRGRYDRLGEPNRRYDEPAIA